MFVTSVVGSQPPTVVHNKIGIRRWEFIFVHCLRGRKELPWIDNNLIFEWMHWIAERFVNGFGNWLL